MKMKKYLACLTAALMMGAAFTACGGSNESPASADEPVQEAPATAPEAANGGENGSADEDSAAADSAADDEASADSEADDEDSAVEVTPAEDVDMGEPKDAGAGQAYLAIVDGQWWVQYWGSSTKDGYMLSYDAGIADITGNGSYTVSVTTDTNGFRYDTNDGDVDGEFRAAEGMNFLAVMIEDGENTCPGAVITIDSVLVDGQEITLTGKNYTSSDDGVVTRANIYNEWVDTPSQDAHSTEGAFYDEEGNALIDDIDDYSAQIVDPADFSQWTTVEVNFTVSGLDGTAAPAADDDSADEGDGEADSSVDAAVDADAEADAAAE